MDKAQLYLSVLARSLMAQEVAAQQVMWSVMAVLAVILTRADIPLSLRAEVLLGIKVAEIVVKEARLRTTTNIHVVLVPELELTEKTVQRITLHNRAEQGQTVRSDRVYTNRLQAVGFPPNMLLVVEKMPKWKQAERVEVMPISITLAAVAAAVAAPKHLYGE